MKNDDIAEETVPPMGHFNQSSRERKQSKKTIQVFAEMY